MAPFFQNSSFFKFTKLKTVYYLFFLLSPETNSQIRHFNVFKKLACDLDNEEKF